jgi:hypothetical protein
MPIKLQFGQYKGYTLEEINKIDHSYLVYLATLSHYGKEYLKPVVNQALKMTTIEERRKKRKEKQYHNSKLQEVDWLIKWTGSMVASENQWVSNFCNSIRRQLITEHRIDKITFKQLKILFKIWVQEHGEEAKEDFIRNFRGKWSRKTHTLDELMHFNP